MDSEQQGMRVSVTEEGSGIVVVDGSTEDNDERSVHLDSIEISSSKAYVIKYEFFQKNIGMKSFEDKTISSGHLGASGCTKPFVIQELLIAAKQLIVSRSKKYTSMRSDPEQKKLLGDTEHDITDLQTNCNFSTLNNEHETHARGEVGLYCQRHTYTYHIGGAPTETNLVYTRQFSVVGAEKEAVTYLFDLTIGFEFAMAAQLKAVL